MPSITFTSGDLVEPIEVTGMKLADLVGFLEAIFGVAREGLELVADGRAGIRPFLALSVNPNQTAEEFLSSNQINPATFDGLVLVRTLPSVAAGGSGTSMTTSASSATRGGTRRSSHRAPPPVKVYYQGMTIDDVFETNRNPRFVAEIIRADDVIWRQLNFHHPELANSVRNAESDEEAATFIQTFLLQATLDSSLSRLNEGNVASAMSRRLQTNPNDLEAKAYFAEKERKARVNAQYEMMMHEYPEAMGRVLMLYIETEINGVRVQAFVDSGAQTSVMSVSCATRCGLMDLVDERFKTTMVGVGKQESLGRVHIAPLKIGTNFFPCTITVMSKEGAGDVNMEFLLGLDMLKRHRCTIDLERGLLWFHSGNVKCSTPFLHEKDLPKEKGGVLGSGWQEEEEVNGGASSSSSSTTSRVSPRGVRLEGSGGAASGGNATEAGVRELMSLGYSRAQAESALGTCHGDVELAKTALMFVEKKGGG